MRFRRARTGSPDRIVSGNGNVAAGTVAPKFLPSRVPGSRRLGLVATTLALALGTSLLLTVVPGVAEASPPVGTCTSSYTQLTYDQAGMLPDGALAQAAFNVSKNGDAYGATSPTRMGRTTAITATSFTTPRRRTSREETDLPSGGHLTFRAHSLPWGFTPALGEGSRWGAGSGTATAGWTWLRRCRRSRAPGCGRRSRRWCPRPESPGGWR